MNFIWQIQPEDIEKVRLLVDSHLEDRLVKERIAKNLGLTMPTIGKEEFWHSMVSCLTTTVARAGPNSAVAKFAEMEPFPLAYSTCLPHLRNLAAFAQPVLRDKGRLRRNGRIAEELAVNLASLESGGWDEVFKRLASMWNNEPLRWNEKRPTSLTHLRVSARSSLVTCFKTLVSPGMKFPSTAG